MNMGKNDRIIRAIVGVAAIVIAFLLLSGGWQIALWVIGGILLLTAIVGFCPAYRLFHYSTKPKDY